MSDGAELFKILHTEFADVVDKEMLRAQAMHELGLSDVATTIHLSIDGGSCVICGKQWREVKCENRYASFSYFVPDCNCYPKCRCGRKMYEEYHGAEIVVKMNGDKERKFLRCKHCGHLQPITGWEKHETN